MDLFEFNFDGNKIDYNEILFCIHFNLKFVISSKYNVDNQLMLIHRDDSTEISIRLEFNNYPGVRSCDNSVKTIRINNGQ